MTRCKEIFSEVKFSEDFVLRHIALDEEGAKKKSIVRANSDQIMGEYNTVFIGYKIYVDAIKNLDLNFIATPDVGTEIIIHLPIPENSKGFVIQVGYMDHGNSVANTIKTLNAGTIIILKGVVKKASENNGKWLYINHLEYY